MPDLRSLGADLAAEHDSLDRIVAPLDEAKWDTTTPARWTVRDQISHLTFFDEQARYAVEDPDGFRSSLGTAGLDVAGYMQAPLDKGRSMAIDEVLQWWRGARAEMLDAFAGLDPETRIGWYGPPMSPASFISARIMETWAHGQDVVDALGIDRDPTARLRHVAHLGVRARPFSFQARGLEVPTDPVSVELTGPGGDSWKWDEGASDVVRGDACDFCLVVTQRRHIDDTELIAEGPAARQWMSIAQAYAGAPGEGRRPGQFPR